MIAPPIALLFFLNINAALTTLQQHFATLLALPLLAFALALTGCDSGGADDSSGTCLSAMVDGERFSTNECEALYVTRFEYSGTLSLFGGTFLEDGEGIDLKLFDVDRGDTGTYVATRGGLAAEVALSYYLDRGFGANNTFATPEGEGSVVIEEFNKERISGTFEFEAVADDDATVNVTEGSFDIATPDG